MATQADGQQERMLWAGLAVVVRQVHEGPEAAQGGTLEWLDATCQTFGVGEQGYERLARVLGFFYYRPWDAYLDRETFYEAGLREGYTGWMPAAKGVH